MRAALVLGLVVAAAATGLPFLTAPASALGPATAQAAASATAPAPKTVILGFDGMDHALTQRLMAEGRMPSFQRLADEGLFQPLHTSNPAQSPVSWAVFNTGCNPGKTAVAGFISRKFTETTTRPDGSVSLGRPIPQLMLGFPEKIPADDFVAFPLALQDRTLFLAAAAGAGLFAGLLLGLLLRVTVRAAWIVVVALCLTGGGAAAFAAADWASGLPADGKLPYIVNPMQGKSFWSYLDAIGIRTRGVAVASTYPPDDEGPQTELLSGLGVMDVTGSPGTWYVFTNSQWEWSDRKTATSGQIVKLHEDEPGRLAGRLIGPRNWLVDAQMRAPIDALAAQRDALKAELAGATADPRVASLRDLEGRIAALEAEYRQWSGAVERSRVTVPFTLTPDTAAHAVTVDVAGQTLRVEQGGWSGMVRVEFPFSDTYRTHGLVTFHVIRCEADDEGTRVFVPPINIDPLDPPPQIPISAPPQFAAELQHEIGHPYETLGWACITNPLKDFEDSKLPEQSFMDDLQTTEALREELLMAGLQRAGEWDVYFQVFSTPDRAGHMLFREFDAAHPKHDAALAETSVHAFGRTFPLKDAIPQVYMNADRIVGRVLDAIGSGALPPDTLLLVVSDHGFSSFRRQVNLNNALHELGYLVFRETDDTGAPLSGVESILDAPGSVRDMLGYVDWTRTRAYSLGLGEVFVNLAGREPQGIVKPGEYDALVEAIRADLLALKDPQDGAAVVTSVSRRDVLYNGPWWKEGTALRKVYRKMVEVEHDGFADLFLGYAPFYRVAWANSLGGLDGATITDNDNHWSGDHVSVDPSHVPGILLANRRMARPAEAGLMDVGPTILERYGLDPSPPHTEMDGHPLPLQDVTR